MFDIGFQELVLIAILALLVAGPERLPGLARNCGLWIGRLKRYINNARREIEQELKLDEDMRFDDKLSDLDNLMRDAPDRQPGKRKEKPVEKPDASDND